MPGSKFNRHPTPRLRPAICYPPPGSCLETWPDDQPKYLAAFVRGVWLNCPTPVDWTALLQLPKDPLFTTWFAQALFADGRMYLQLQSFPPSGRYLIRLEINVWPDFVFRHTWDPVPSSRPQYFDSGVLTHVAIPATQYMQTRVMGNLPVA